MVDPETIYNWRRLDDRITTSGQPTEQQLADIQALGVRHIINLGLHTHEKALPGEAASVGRLGMTYIHIPVDFQNPTDEDFAKFCSVMDQLKEVPVHIHCIVSVAEGRPGRGGSHLGKLKRARTGIHERFGEIKLTLTTHTYCS